MKVKSLLVLGVCVIEDIRYMLIVKLKQTRNFNVEVGMKMGMVI